MKGETKMSIVDPTSKAKFTTASRAYVAASKTEAQAKAAKKEAAAVILEMLNGEKSLLWTANDNSSYQVTAIYGKTSKNLNADLIASVLGVVVTPECYKESKPWDEIRISVKA